ncbi:hypothetical protein [Aquamicrobium defluvii]|uniref:DUF551 domain-containing protein n=1 Tax=Aquamicrobium defluvii TaxID=69279 RepID=A0A011VMQ7_9HYPH|nr:hypothetical protein [Aquamicrobium defluvii]EXL09680.1 hypothetical protein BG36_21505 [Aquamicrobium defluvii]EZQ16287.1 hypothetical protein CF98_40205 [Halopseudomonas bauzanensis]TDR36832.1 hypothetical protein DES43_104158 [Aquamicrobium defluvii]
MADREPISSAPKDGSRVTVYWTDSDGVMNESIARWDAGDQAWWAYTDSRTQKKIEPTSWRPDNADDEADEADEEE